MSAPDLFVLHELGERIRELSARDVTSTGVVSRQAEQVRVRWPQPVLIDTVVLGEDIARGQQIDGVVVQATGEDGVTDIARPQSIGYRRIIDVPPQRITELTVRVISARGPVALSEFSVLRPSAFTTARRTGEHTPDR